MRRFLLDTGSASDYIHRRHRLVPRGSTSVIAHPSDFSHLGVITKHGYAWRIFGWSRELCAAITKAGGAAKYTEYPGVGHGSWSKAYAETELWEWLFKQRRKATGR